MVGCPAGPLRHLRLTRLSWGFSPDLAARCCPFRGPPERRLSSPAASSGRCWPPPLRSLPAPGRFSRPVWLPSGSSPLPRLYQPFDWRPPLGVSPNRVSTFGPHPQGLVLGKSPWPPPCKQCFGSIPSWALPPPRLERPGLAPMSPSWHPLMTLLPVASLCHLSAGLQRLPARPPDLPFPRLADRHGVSGRSSQRGSRLRRPE